MPSSTRCPSSASAISIRRTRRRGYGPRSLRAKADAFARLPALVAGAGAWLTHRGNDLVRQGRVLPEELRPLGLEPLHERLVLVRPALRLVEPLRLEDADVVRVDPG